MSEEKPKSRHRKFLKFLFIKFPIFLLVLGLIFAFALKTIERYPVPVKDGLQQYISSALNANASIGRIENFSFMPQIQADLYDVTIHNHQNAAEIKASVEKLEFSAPFWSGFFGGGKIVKLNIDGLETGSNYPFITPMFINNASIIDRAGPGQYGSFLIGTGEFRDLPLNFEIKLEKKKGYYKIPETLPFSLSLGQRVIKGTLKTSYKTIDLANLIYQKEGQSSEAREYSLVRKEEYLSDNPLSCVLLESELKTCDQYLNE